MSETPSVVSLPGNTLLHSEVHACVMDIAKQHGTAPLTITIFDRGNITYPYERVVNTGGDKGHTQELSEERQSTVAAYTIFRHDEFFVEFENEMTVKFMTPELIQEQRSKSHD